MSPNNAGDSFEDTVRAILRDAARAAEKAATGNVDAIAEAVGVEPARARQWLDGVTRWVGEHAPAAEDIRVPEAWSTPRAKADDPPAGAGPHPLDTPSAEQGLALAALDSGRWSVEPGSQALSTHGEGPGPIDAIGLFGELRARDWITLDGSVTVVGRHALTRWLAAADQH
jgi:hypothetical protein